MDTLFWGYHKHHLSVSYRNAQVDQLLSKRPKKPVQTQTHKIKQDFESPGSEEQLHPRRTELYFTNGPWLVDEAKVMPK